MSVPKIHVPRVCTRLIPVGLLKSEERTTDPRPPEIVAPEEIKPGSLLGGLTLDNGLLDRVHFSHSVSIVHIFFGAESIELFERLLLLPMQD